MRIACPNCAAEYTLDERLLPAGGAPVQCTSCNHVFTAMPRATPAPAEPPRRHTAEHGMEGAPQVPAAEAAAAPANQTMRFGAFVPPGATGAQAHPKQTQAFGAVGAGGPKETQRFGAAETAAIRGATRPYGAVSPAARAGRPGDAAPHSTQIFGAVTPRTSTPPPDPLPASRPNQTLVFGRPPGQLPVELGLGNAEAERKDGLGPGVIPGPERLTIYEDRPPLIPPAVKRRLLRVAALAAALVAVVFFGFKVVERLRATPPELVAEEQSALGQLRLDDPASRKQALARLDQVIARAPHFVEPRADRALLLALALDDLRAPLALIDTETASLDGDIERLSDAKTPSDWEVRVNALRDRKATLGRERARIAQEAKTREAELDRALAALPQPSEDASTRNLAVVRARAIAAGVAGTGSALELAERYGTFGDPGGWSALALAEYAINAHAPPETVQEVRVKLRALKAQDPAFLRPYVLIARLDLSENRRAEALAELEAAVALNPEHALAHRLLGALGRTGEDAAAP